MVAQPCCSIKRPLSQASLPFTSLSFSCFSGSALICQTQIDPKRSATALAATCLAIASAVPLVTHPPHLKPMNANSTAPPTALHKPTLILPQSIDTPLRNVWNTPVQLPVEVKNPVLRAVYC